jgi:hypothetical protein
LKSNIGSRQADDARVLLAEARTTLAVVAAAVELWQKALDDLDHPGTGKPSPYRLPLLAPAGGEVTDLLPRPGTSVEAGAAAGPGVPGVPGSGWRRC